jgi:hypothetical protein
MRNDVEITRLIEIGVKNDEGKISRCVWARLLGGDL